MILEPAVLSIIIAKIRAGKFKNLGNVNIKGWYFLIVSAGIQLSLSLLKVIDRPFSIRLVEDYFFYIMLLSYLFLGLVIFLNIFKLSMKIFLIGFLLNSLVIFSNGAKMPVAIDGIDGSKNIKIELRTSDIKHEAMTEDTRLPFLGDIIRIPPPYPLPKILSIGDVFLIVGVFVFFQEAMTAKNRSEIKMISTIREPLE